MTGKIRRQAGRERCAEAIEISRRYRQAKHEWERKMYGPRQAQFSFADKQLAHNTLRDAYRALLALQRNRWHARREKMIGQGPFPRTK